MSCASGSTVAAQGFEWTSSTSSPKYQPEYKHYANGSRLHEYLKEMNRKVLSKYDTMTVGEMPFVQDMAEIMRAVGAQEEELNMIFIFEMVDIDNVPGAYRMML